MEIAPKYDPRAVEDKWYAFWLEKKLFHSEPDPAKKPFTIVIPPPNVTGVLHMGHMLNNTIQDVLIRRARMMGLNACWVPGTDHASIATEAKVVNMLKERGIDKHDISRDEFMKYAWEWKEEHGGIILKQLRKLGCSCDWDRTAFTMDDVRYESVIKVFVDLYRQGLIYRGVRMVNWDPKALTAVSDEEVIYKESNSKLFYLRYYVDNGDGTPGDKYVVVATTRPETILGDTAVCVHPEDDRHQWLKGRRVIVPLVGRSVPIIMDEYVDREFGTGALKITPAHDVNDYNLGMKYGLESINIFNDNGTLNDNGGAYKDMDRFACRKQIMKDLQEHDLVEKIEDYVNKVGHSERTDAVIEPKLSAQWFLKMSELAPKALEVVENDEIQFHPAKFKNVYRHWLENIKDWCISRQLWWGQRIPAFYYEADGRQEVAVAETLDEAFAIATKEHPSAGITKEMLRQDEDVLDTWFSSWLWPVSLFDGIRHPDNPEIKYYYPTDDLITAPDIIFFWVARMIMAGEKYRKQVPFHHVYFTGIVRDKQGRKMSKSLGNSPDPIMLIEKYGADGVRMGMLLTAPAGNDLPFDESICEQGRNFANKIWNALRLVKGWQRSDTLKQSEINRMSVEWMEQRMAFVLEDIEKDFNQFRLSEALMKTYKLVWDDFCSWYLEMIKPAFGESIDNETMDSTLQIFSRLMCMLHPFMPFITEEIWHLLIERCEHASIMMDRMPVSVFYDPRTLNGFATAQEMITGVRSLRNSKGLSPKAALELYVMPHAEGSQTMDVRFNDIITKLANLNKIEQVDHKVEGALTFMVGTIECFVPMGQNINTTDELKKLEEELRYTEGFLTGVMKKLSNEKFVNSAPEKVVNVERQKKADAEQKIAALQAQMASLKR
jgi:valyl-tRNA synthetase